MSTIRKLMVWSAILAAANLWAAEPPEGRLMRFPDISKDQIIFSYGGDLWLVARSGGVARRITTHPGLELFPKFSPDGKWICFTGQYDGNFNVYAMPSEGGDPKQLTVHPGGGALSERMGIHNEVINWLPDSKHILYLSRRNTFNDWFGQLYTVGLNGGLPDAFPLDKGGLASFSPDGNRIAYNRIFRNFRTWKRYQGGMAQDIWIYNLKSREIEQMPHENWTDTFPMWQGDTIYFDSDRGPEHRLNLYGYSLKTHEIRPLTHFTDFDVNWPSLGPDAIVFENGGFLYVFDLKTEKATKLTVYLPGDRDFARKRWANVAGLITDMDISPDGHRAAFSARGDIFTVPAKEGSIRNLTRTPGIRERYAAWSPDGKWVATMSDRTGEDELLLMPQDGMGKEVRVTTDGTMFRLQPVWSPDSKRLLYADKSLRLFYVDTATRTPVLIDQGKYADLTDYAWSPDSQWVAYAKAAENGYSAIYLYSLADRKITPVTTSFTNSGGPVFDPEGRYLYFLSLRDYNEVLGQFDFEFANPKPTRVYVATLQKSEPSPFAPKSDEAGSPPIEAEKPKTTETATKTETKPAPAPAKPFHIDLDGIEDRVVGLTIPPGNLRSLQATKGYVFYMSVFDLKERKDSVLISGISNYAVSFDGSKVLYAAPAGEAAPGAEEEGRRAQTFGIIDAKPPATEPHKAGEGALNLSEMKMEIDPPAEWRQIFYEVWRQERDYFYEPSMNGVDWAKERDKYAELLPYVADRYDLTYVLGELIGELSNSHTYVGGGDYPNLHPVNVGLLGADFEEDAENGLYRFKKIYHGENWQANLRSPLTEPGVDVHEGDYLLALNGRTLNAPTNPETLFVNTVG
ncbi:MAG: protease, partial [Acidobacteria bacterium]